MNVSRHASRNMGREMAPCSSKRRWSLIAGRLPGRTANDVKNYWNSSMRRRVSSDQQKKDKCAEPKADDENAKPHEVIEPLPRTFPKNSSPPSCCSRLQGKFIGLDHDSTKQYCTIQAAGSSDSLDYGCAAELQVQVANDNTCSLDEGVLPDLWDMELLLTMTGNNVVVDFPLQGRQSWSDFLLDMNLWDF